MCGQHICVVYCLFRMRNKCETVKDSGEICKDKMNKGIIMRKKRTWWTSSLSCHWSDGRQKAVTDTAEAEKIIITIDQHNMVTAIIIITNDHHNMIRTIIIITIDQHNMIPTIIVITIDQHNMITTTIITNIDQHC